MKVLTFGELMLRLTPPGYQRFVQAEAFGAAYGGAEANVAVALANMGADAGFVSKLPENALGQAALNSLRRYGVDTARILRGGERLGLYYLERGASQRGSQVIYDRKNSAFAQSTCDEYDWDAVFTDCDWFHLTGITPTLSKALAQSAENACQIAREKGITVSFDPNYRAKLWSVQEASAVLSRFLPLSDILITNENQAAELFGIRIPACEKDGDHVSDAGYEALAKALFAAYGFRYLALTERRTLSAEQNTFRAMLFDGKRLYCSVRYTIDMVDRVGAGDAFAAGLIYAVRERFDPQRAIDFAAASGCIKHTVEGDCSLVSADEISALAESAGTGRVQR